MKTAGKNIRSIEKNTRRPSKKQQGRIKCGRKQPKMDKYKITNEVNELKEKEEGFNQKKRFVKV